MIGLDPGGQYPSPLSEGGEGILVPPLPFTAPRVWGVAFLLPVSKEDANMVYVSTSAEIGCVDIEFEVDTEDITSEVMDAIDLEEKIQEALGDFANVVVLAQAIVDFNDAHQSLYRRMSEARQELATVTDQLSAVRKELETSQAANNGASV